MTPFSTRRRLAGCLLALAVLVTGSCSDDGGTSAGSTSSTSDAGATKAEKTKAKKDKSAVVDEDGGGDKKACADTSGRAPAGRATLRQISDDGPRVDAAVYPHPDYEGRPWSQWGQGVALDGGRFFSALGDHCGLNGDSYVYELDGAELTMVGDVLSAVDHTPGAWGHGKIHAQMVEGPDGAVYTSTYWGSRTGLTLGKGYDGDVLLRIDPDDGDIESLGVPVPGHGIPSLAALPGGDLLYGEAVDPEASPKAGVFFVYDMRARKVVFTSDTADHAGFRNIMVDKRGRAWFSAGEGRLQVWDPESRKLELSDVKLPGELLRASTAPGPDGTVYGVTRKPEVFFALRPDGTIDELGPARGYTASMALAPDGSRFYYVPDAHGTSWREGTPLVSVDTRSGQERVVVELNPLAERKLRLRLGGSYGVALSPDGRRAYVGLNAGPAGSEDTFGTVVLAVVDLR